jgi:hypothetical protein
VEGGRPLRVKPPRGSGMTDERASMREREGERERMAVSDKVDKMSEKR